MSKGALNRLVSEIFLSSLPTEFFTNLLANQIAVYRWASAWRKSTRVSPRSTGLISVLTGQPWRKIAGA